MEVEDRKVGKLGAMPRMPIELLSSDEEEVDATPSQQKMPRSASRVARMPSPARRKRDLEEVFIDCEEDSTRGSSRKRPAQGKRCSSSSNDEIEVVKTKASPLPLTPLQQVLEIFPDVQVSHAQKLLQEHSNVPANVINALIEEGSSYPKEPAKGKTPQLASWSSSSEKQTYDFMSSSSFEPTSAYVQESTQRLAYDFPCFTQTGTKFFLGKSSHHYAIAHDKIVRAITGKDDKNSRASKEDIEETHYNKLTAVIFQKKELDKDQKQRLGKIFSCTCRDNFFAKNRKKTAPSIKDPILKEEIDHVDSKLQEWINSVELLMTRRAARKECIQEGTSVECGCCYGDFAFDEMMQCKDGHLFCPECLSDYVVNQVFDNGNFGVNPRTKEPNLELVCFHVDGCTSGFHRFILEKTLTPLILQKYDELQTRVSLAKAGLDQNMCTCPECGFSAEVTETQNVFACLQCGYESCRHCREASHIPLRCDEVVKESEAQGRARVEEAASAAVIRNCPKCKKGVIKSDGCNKITCACGEKWCYLCRKVIKDYTHFCQTPHCTHSSPKKCGYKCALYTKDAEEDAKRMREAAEAEAERVQEDWATASNKEKKSGIFTQDEDKKQPPKPTGAHIDVDSILRAPDNRARH